MLECPVPVDQEQSADNRGHGVPGEHHDGVVLQLGTVTDRTRRGRASSPRVITDGRGEASTGAASAARSGSLVREMEHNLSGGKCRQHCREGQPPDDSHAAELNEDTQEEEHQRLRQAPPQPRSVPR